MRKVSIDIQGRLRHTDNKDADSAKHLYRIIYDKIRPLFSCIHNFRVSALKSI